MVNSSTRRRRQVDVDSPNRSKAPSLAEGADLIAPIPHKEPRAAVAAVEIGAVTVTEFGRLYRLSRSKFYKLLAAGEGPRTFHVGRRRYVARDAALDWQRDRELRG